MKSSSFYTSLILTSLIAFAVAFLFLQLSDFQEAFYVLLIEILFFIVSAIFLHALAVKAARDKNKYVFSRITMMNTFIKLIIVVGIVAVYKTVFLPESINFVWPFLLIYILYTVFETRFLLKAARL